MKKQMKQFQDVSCNSDHSEDITLDDTASCSTLSRCDFSIGNSERSGVSGGAGVRFAMNATEYHQVESWVNYSRKERAKCWLSEQEQDKTVAKQERLVRKYEMKMLQKPSSSSSSSKPNKKLGNLRGLESWTEVGSLKLNHAIEECINAVMDEQDRQWNEDDDDSDAIAKCSLQVTEESARRARTRGLMDAREALRVRSKTWVPAGKKTKSTKKKQSTKNKRKRNVSAADKSIDKASTGAMRPPVSSTSSLLGEEVNDKNADDSPLHNALSIQQSHDLHTETPASNRTLQNKDISPLIESRCIREQKEASSWEKNTAKGYDARHSMRVLDPPGRNMSRLELTRLGENDTGNNLETKSAAAEKKWTAIRLSFPSADTTAGTGGNNGGASNLKNFHKALKGSDMKKCVAASA